MVRAVLRALLALFYAVAGILHLVMPDPFLSIMPAAIPFAREVVLLTGVAELAGAAALIQPWSHRLRKAAGVGLALYALCVWPANVNHMLIDLGKPSGGAGLVYHIPRMIAQPMLIWLALWVGEATDWPFRRTREPRA
ncbi:hypothetical protein GRI38_07815 [Altererythrobacter aurantiacus]|uniref:DoxX-like family protein n=1 Tax=Parapontixanthobacter aurantiacus TaxID=1463599 RepID=A0A844ZDT4_9SPHN|nr:DoxX family protein [Parapontixanthobacter aurantiacus]MXO85938.1 hypothetical protein [Parapontixanthobacter aurantiacus]